MSEIGTAPDGENGLFCFMEQTRVCGPDCMAFQLGTPQGEAYKGEQWAHCKVLVFTERVGRHLPILVNVVSDGIKYYKNSKSDYARTYPVPEVK